MDSADSRFTAVISLGGACETAIQMERFFGGRKTSSPFDFLVTPFNALRAVLEDDGDGFGREFEPIWDGGSVKCLRYGVLYHHEFARSPAGKIQFSAAQIANCREKLLHKYATMLDVARRNRTLFVRLGASTDAPGDPHAGQPFTHADLADLRGALAARLGHDQFHIAFIDMRGEHRGRRFDDLIQLEQLPPGTSRTDTVIANETPDGGDPVFWGEFFRSFGLQPDTPLAV